VRDPVDGSVFEDADLDQAVAGAMASKFRNAGQTCISGNRSLVHAAGMHRFLQQLLARVAAMTVRPGTEDGIDVGPLIDDAGLAKLQEHVVDARERAATVLCGGEPLGGRFYSPTVISGATPELKLLKEETFGPVLPIMSFEDEDHTVSAARADATESSSTWSPSPFPSRWAHDEKTLVDAARTVGRRLQLQEPERARTTGRSA
jgi:succinate-semialdehyde dehydrogenase/glutarate-semialdehyde dehydrogenase